MKADNTRNIRNGKKNKTEEDLTIDQETNNKITDMTMKMTTGMVMAMEMVTGTTMDVVMGMTMAEAIANNYS
jgi:hypothetical protein